ncbi:hypothetical protein [Anaeromyxobacter sp. Fw109-5]|uniref:hypothetical protein n=1 Tax=Anaeromyxobacter sp. (strain Fw109-5) TaxID=404589 RepID=UPI00117FFE98|nr:hypothetical protein [Anaeromyxobacter sp. Fw109-5]
MSERKSIITGAGRSPWGGASHLIGLFARARYTGGRFTVWGDRPIKRGMLLAVLMAAVPFAGRGQVDNEERQENLCKYLFSGCLGNVEEEERVVTKYPACRKYRAASVSSESSDAPATSGLQTESARNARAWLKAELTIRFISAMKNGSSHPATAKAAALVKPAFDAFADACGATDECKASASAAISEASEAAKSIMSL